MFILFVSQKHKYNSLKRTQLRSANLLMLQADVTADTWIAFMYF